MAVLSSSLLFDCWELPGAVTLPEDEPDEEDACEVEDEDVVPRWEELLLELF